MNILFTSSDPKECPKWMHDRLLNKLILESTQMLSTALRVHGSLDERLYKITHVNHPSNIWTRQTRSNFIWHLEYLKAMILENMARTGKLHACNSKVSVFEELVNVIPDGPLTDFANCARHKSLGLDFTNLPVIEAYRKYVVARVPTYIKGVAFNKIHVTSEYYNNLR